MKNKEFFDKEHANSYLSSSVITLEDEPIYIFSVGDGKKGSYKLKFVSLKNPDSDPKYVMSGHKDIDMTPVKLGMLSDLDNNFTGASYVYRTPLRGWKIGLSSHNMGLFNPIGSRLNYSKNSLIASKALYNTIKGIYPDIIKAAKYEKLTAFSRRFAVLKDKLYNKFNEEPVGLLPKNKIPELFEEYSYLQQALDEDLHGRA